MKKGSEKLEEHMVELEKLLTAAQQLTFNGVVKPTFVPKIEEVKSEDDLPFREMEQWTQVLNFIIALANAVVLLAPYALILSALLWKHILPRLSGAY